jgi:hypothetical protein
MALGNWFFQVRRVSSIRAVYYRWDCPAFAFLKHRLRHPDPVGKQMSMPCLDIQALNLSTTNLPNEHE